MNNITKDSKYLKFIDKGLELAKQIPRYFSKFSNKIFCNHQKIVLLVLKQKLRTTYRDLVELLKITNIPMYIGLNKIPHHTTLVKFAKKIGFKFLNSLLPFRKAKITGVDGTGFEVENQSRHYQMRTGKGFLYRRYIKVGVSADLNKQIILKQEIHKSPRNDHKDFKPLLNGLKTKFVCADKGYDSYANHKFIFEKLNAKSFIKLKKWESRKGKYFSFRNKAKNIYNDKIYHQRSKVETIFSVIKRKYGSALRSRSFATQKKEVICKLIVYNLERLIIDFLRVSA